MCGFFFFYIDFMSVLLTEKKKNYFKMRKIKRLSETKEIK